MNHDKVVAAKKIAEEAGYKVVPRGFASVPSAVCMGSKCICSLAAINFAFGDSGFSATYIKRAEAAVEATNVEIRSLEFGFEGWLIDNYDEKWIDKVSYKLGQSLR